MAKRNTGFIKIKELDIIQALKSIQTKQIGEI